MRSLAILATSLLLSVSSEAQQSFGRVDIRCQRASNTVQFRSADTNVTIGYATWRPENPRSCIAGQKIVGTNWTEVAFQFSIRQNDTITLTVRGRFREPTDATNAPVEWVWADLVSLAGTNNVDIVRNGSFEKVHGGFPRLYRKGQPEKWGYHGEGREIRHDESGAFPHDGARCIKVSHGTPARQSFHLRSNQWYTVKAWFRSDASAPTKQ